MTVNIDPSVSGSKDATDSTQQDATSPATPDPTAAVIAVVIAPPAVVPTDASQAAANSNAPLAIAAAGLAASASTAAQLTSPTPAKADPDAVAPTTAETTAPAPAVDVTAPTKPAVQTNASAIVAAAGAKQDVAPQTDAVNAEAASNGAANAPIQPTPVKSAAKSHTKVSPANLASGSDASTAEPASADAGPASPAAAATPDASPGPSGAKGQGNTDLVAVKPQASDGAPSTASFAAPGHDHVSMTVATDSPSDAGMPATSTMQPQLSSVATTTAASTSTLGVATPGTSAVPLSGLPIEIAASVRSGKTRFDVRLDPADLGRIDVRISVDRNGQIISHLTVEKPETLAMLQQDAPQLQRALDDAGLKTGSNGLQFSLRDQSSSGQNNGNDNSGNARRLIITEDEAVPAAVAGRNYGRMLGSSGGIDIRV
ncbi:flagellar hook-length control protein FliK [Bradyrhizobium sp.]|uniref:flagellar hook-length control protein FliK n=1 Tax=Bradyrhizobium sp. TaxID=376 RepID=UPI0025BE74DF|nr:flagellar hook-length control protein FliK [Bradyrhizobium sp.]